MTEFDRIVMAFLALLVVVLSLMVTRLHTRVHMLEADSRNKRDEAGDHR